MFLNDFEIKTISDALAEIGKIKIYHKDKIKDIPDYIFLIEKFYKEYKDANFSINTEIKNLEKKIDEAKNFLNSENLLFNSEELEEDLKIHLDILDELVYIELGLEEIKNNPIYSKLKLYAQKIEQISSELYQWFYNDFEPYRLIPFNSYRKYISSLIPEDIKLMGLFPWYDLHCEENPEIFFQIAVYLTTNQSRSVPSDMLPIFLAAKKDKVLKKYILSLYQEINLVKSTLEANPEVSIIYILSLIDEEIIFEKRISEELNKKYPAVALEFLKREKDLFLSLICGPLEYIQRFEWFKKYGELLREKKYNNLLELAKHRNIKSLKKELKALMNKWLEKCERLAPEVEIVYNPNWYYENFYKTLKQNIENLGREQSIIISLKEWKKELKKWKEWIKTKLQEKEKHVLSPSFSGIGSLPSFQQDDIYKKGLEFFKDNKLECYYKFKKEGGNTFLGVKFITKEKDIHVKKIKIILNSEILYPDSILKQDLEKHEDDFILLPYKKGTYKISIKLSDKTSYSFDLNVS